jgi:hypothetical protein
MIYEIQRQPTDGKILIESSGPREALVKLLSIMADSRKIVSQKGNQFGIQNGWVFSVKEIGKEFLYISAE